MTALVLAELNASDDGVVLAPATLSAVTAAKAIDPSVHLLVSGSGIAGVAGDAAGVAGIERVLLADAPELADGLAEPLTEVVVSLVGERRYGAIVAAATSTGKNLVPRVAARLDVAPVTDVIAVVDAATFRRPIYAGNAIQTVGATDAIKIVTVRPTAFAPVGVGAAAVAIETIAVTVKPAVSRFVSRDRTVTGRPDLAQARIVVSGGRALNSRENFALIEGLADALGAAVGATRAAVDAGYASNAQQVGQTGKVIAPDLYIAVGLSGAIQHLAGIKDAKTIVAINKDADAPIMQFADYALLGDLFDLVPQVIASIERMHAKS